MPSSHWNVHFRRFFLRSVNSPRGTVTFPDNIRPFNLWYYYMACDDWWMKTDEPTMSAIEANSELDLGWTPVMPQMRQNIPFDISTRSNSPGLSPYHQPILPCRRFWRSFDRWISFVVIVYASPPDTARFPFPHLLCGLDLSPSTVSWLLINSDQCWYDWSNRIDYFIPYRLSTISVLSF